MQDVLFHLGGAAIRTSEAAMAFAGVMLALLCAILVAVSRAGRSRGLQDALAAERQHELDERIADLVRMNAELSDRKSVV